MLARPFHSSQVVMVRKYQGPGSGVRQKCKNQRLKSKMTTQNVKLLERGGCVVYHFNREGRDSFTPRNLSQSRRPGAEMNSATTISHCEADSPFVIARSEATKQSQRDC